MEKLLITGISGFLGWNLAHRLKDRYRIYGTCLDNPVSIPGVEVFTFDLADWSKVERLCQSVNPAAIVHAAAYANPDYCELHHKEALTLNTFATRELAKAANRLGSKLIYISTDFVFDGRRGEYSEADDPAPINYYGKTKFLGELEIMNHCSHYVTLRIGTLYGRGNGIRPNFFSSMMLCKQSANSSKERTLRGCFIWEDRRRPAGGSLLRRFVRPWVRLPV
jgi:dTDP-4-dehydrorhamnose reductase